VLLIEHYTSDAGKATKVIGSASSVAEKKK
jgi:hypothetical protein